MWLWFQDLVAGSKVIVIRGRGESLLFIITWKVDNVTNELITLAEVVVKHNVNSMCWCLWVAFDKLFHSQFEINS